MDEQENNEKSKISKTSVLAIISLILPLIAFALALLTKTIGATLILLIISLFLAVIAGLIELFKSKTKRSFNPLAGLAPAINTILFLLFLSGISQVRTSKPPPPHCALHLRSLSIAMLMYAQDNNDIYPPADKWCDSLLINGYVQENGNLFRCGRDRVGPCSYAMNPYCEPNSPSDTVLLFESKPGWNQSGGPELLNFDNHRGGCNVVFNDGRIEFVKPKDANNLKWKP